MKELQSEIIEMQIAIIKEKISNCCFEEQQRLFEEHYLPGKDKIKKLDHKEIAVHDNIGPSNVLYQEVIIRNADRYANFFGAKNTIDDTIANYIKEISRLQSITNPSINDLRRALESIESFAIYSLKLENGNLVAFQNRDFIIEKEDVEVK